VGPPPARSGSGASASSRAWDAAPAGPLLERLLYGVAPSTAHGTGSSGRCCRRSPSPRRSFPPTVRRGSIRRRPEGGVSDSGPPGPRVPTAEHTCAPQDADRRLLAWASALVRCRSGTVGSAGLLERSGERRSSGSDAARGGVGAGRAPGRPGFAVQALPQCGRRMWAVPSTAPRSGLQGHRATTTSPTRR
jgi:hypothetical protein